MATKLPERPAETKLTNGPHTCCPESQADGVPCPDAKSDCARCGRAHDWEPDPADRNADGELLPDGLYTTS
jgi:hypothetical protein